MGETSARCSVDRVFPGVALAAFLVHGVSVSIGHFLGATLPTHPMDFASAIAFLIFAVWA